MSRIRFIDPVGTNQFDKPIQEFLETAKAPEQKGIEMFGPRHFGYDLDYMPVEMLNG